MALAPQIVRKVAAGQVAAFSIFNKVSSFSQASPAGAAAVQLFQKRNISYADLEFYRSLPKAKYGGKHTVTLLPGEGIGPEVMDYIKHIFRRTGVPIIFEEIRVDPNNRDTEELDGAIASIRRNGVAIKGNIETRSLDTRIVSRNVMLRTELDLFASVFVFRSFPNVPARHKDVDIIVIRQNTDGEFAMLEHEVIPGVAECLKIMTDEHAERLARFAFTYAKKHGRKKVTLIHKANIMKLSDGLFLDVAKRVAKDFPDIEHDDMIVDNCCMQLVSNPHQFDVMLSTNLFGSIIVNVICGITRGGGLFAGQDFSDEYGVFEAATRNTGTRMIGKNVANPIAYLMASAYMLRFLKLERHYERLMSAIDKTINEDKIHTPDLGGSASTSDVINKIQEHMHESMRD